ncbi:24214_t:CDS:2 [Cetraspora pellucida]|uniref:24214_t:CDS:1 n=1 Tax=Cetraspora pellucida TaxID=1433469 RepID=A0A9N9EK67_9GLOM|nr:24214_t:CDS:2 [Cetraspora pellucida]
MISAIIKHKNTTAIWISLIITQASCGNVGSKFNLLISVEVIVKQSWVLVKNSETIKALLISFLCNGSMPRGAHTKGQLLLA